MGIQSRDQGVVLRAPVAHLLPVEDPIPATAAGWTPTGASTARWPRSGAVYVWDLVDAVLAAAARDSPDALRARHDGIMERLYAGACCRDCDIPPAPAQPRTADEAAATVASPASPDEEVDADGLSEYEAGAGVESKILDITYKA